MTSTASDPEAAEPPHLGRWLWPIGIVIGVLLLWLSGSAARGRRIAVATAAGVWAATCGILGVILTLLWTVTDHRFAHANENLLLFNPLWLVLAVTLPMFLSRARLPRTTRWLTQLVTYLTLIALIAHIIPLSRQDNLPLIGLTLPVALALSVIVYRHRAGAVV